MLCVAALITFVCMGLFIAVVLGLLISDVGGYFANLCLLWDNMFCV